MATEITDIPESDSAQTPPTHTSISLWERVALGAVLLISAFVNIFQLDQQGYGNLYYAAAVKSMLENFHNLWYVSFDPGGFVTVDKPPLGLWIQAASAKVFGFSGLSVLLPEAIAGVLSVALLYFLVRRIFGPAAGLIAALTLALTPISVVTSRNNTPDSLLVLTLLLATRCVSLAAEKGRLRWLLLTALIIGLGFNIKMLQAYLVVPAFGLVYLLGAPLKWRTRIVHLTLAALVLLVVSLSWVLAVDLTPASQRPYVGSSQANSEINLAFGYNGLERLTGYHRGNSDASTPSTTTVVAPSENGGTGPLRLFNTQLGGQISWLLPLAILGLLVAGWQTRVRLPLQRHQQALALWGTWLITMYVFFSVANFYHRYYLSMLAPAICALVGIGIVSLWKDYQRIDWRRWLLPGTLLITAFVQVWLLSAYSSWSRWLTPIIVSLSIVVTATLIIGQLLPHLRPNPGVTIAAGLLALLFAPTTWSALPVWQGVNPTLPFAGPSSTGANNPFARSVGNSNESGLSDAKLIQYLEAKQGHTRYLVATLDVATAAPIILDTGKPVMALGGFTGTDPILTVQQLQSLVSNGTVRFFLLPPPISFNNLPPQILESIQKQILENQEGQNSDLTLWVHSHCSTVPTNLWSSGASVTPPPSPGGDGQPPFPGERQLPFPGSIFPGGNEQPLLPGSIQGLQLYDCAG